MQPDKPYDFVPPAPVRHDVSDEEMMVAEARLRKALMLNKGLKKPRHGIALKDAETFLKWIVENDRLSYHEDYPDKRGLELSDIGGVCGRSASICYWPLEHVLPEERLKIVNLGGLFTHAAGVHEVVGVRLPISEGGQVTDRVFLLDNSYGQFFWPEFNTPPREQYAPGYFITQTQEGREVASELLRDGFIEMTPRNAAVYFRGFEDAGRQARPDIAMHDFLKADPANALMHPHMSTANLRKGGRKVDWLKHEITGHESLSDVALKTPLTAYMGLHDGSIPREVYAQAFNSRPQPGDTAFMVI